MKPAVALVAFAGLLSLSAGRVSTQTDFSGTWTLDRDISADGVGRRWGVRAMLLPPTE